MNRITLVILSIVILMTILIAVVASESAQYTNPIHRDHGITYVTTDNGDQVYDSEYVTGNVVSVKLQAITTINTPVMLPSTSAPHGTYTCNMSSNGTVFTVTNDTPCNQR